MEVEREIVVPEAPEEVWEALTEPERLEEWFATEVELDARPGGEGVFRWGAGDQRRAVVRELEEAVEWMVSVGAAWDERLAALRRSLGGYGKSRDTLQPPPRFRT